jgi:nucleotide-binding universal stress UspA family protein
MMNKPNILVPVDFSTAQSRAVNLASLLARDMNARLVIVHVEEPASAYLVGGAYYGSANPQHEDLVSLLHDVAPSAPDVEYEQRMLSGLPADAIVNCADEIDASFIVMGTHGRTGLSRVLMGSVAEAVVRRAPCAVVTIKEEARTPSESV